MLFSYSLGLDHTFQEIAKLYLPSTLKEWLLVLVSMRLMWILLNFLTWIGEFLQNYFNNK